MTAITVHSARSCACGAGLLLRLGEHSGGGTAALVATREPLVAIDVPDETAIDRAEIPGVRVPDVSCWSCGLTARATHIVVAVDGRPVGADILSAEVHGAYAHLEAERAASERERLGPVGPVPDALPEDVR